MPSAEPLPPETAAAIRASLSRFWWRSREDREDAVQDAWAAVLHRRHLYDPARGAWAVFVFTVVRSEVNAKWGAERRKKRIPRELVGSLDAPCGEDGTPLADLLPDERGDPAVEAESRALVAQALRGVRDPKLKRILLDRARGFSLGDLGVRYGVTREYIRQLEVKALARARRALGA